jgi:hypothetical protein
MGTWRRRVPARRTALGDHGSLGCGSRSGNQGQDMAGGSIGQPIAKLGRVAGRYRLIKDGH